MTAFLNIYTLGTMTITHNYFINAINLCSAASSNYIDFGCSWTATIWNTILGDSLSLIMVTTAPFVITLIMAYGFYVEEHEATVNHFYLLHLYYFLSVGWI